MLLLAALTRQIEVVKCRAQVENQASSKALGSLGITKLIARQEGIKGGLSIRWPRCCTSLISVDRLLPRRAHDRYARHVELGHLFLHM